MRLGKNKSVWICGIAAAGVALLGSLGAIIMNSKKMKTLRTVRRTARVMSTVGDVMKHIGDAI